MPLGQPVEITAVIRRMRGGSQPFLVRASDGFCYVAKFANNPQGNKSLINECLAAHLLTALGVKTPELAILRLGAGCDGRQELYFSMGGRGGLEAGLHLGSRCPVDPDAVAIFDFLPRSLYPWLTNLDDVGVVFAFDHWVAHIDARQFIFARQPERNRPDSEKGVSLTAWAIDHGMCFGMNWALAGNASIECHPCINLYSYSTLYWHCNLEESAERGAKLIESLPASELYVPRATIPQEWFAAGDEKAFESMLEALQKRQAQVGTSVRQQVAAVRRVTQIAS